MPDVIIRIVLTLKMAKDIVAYANQDNRETPIQDVTEKCGHVTVPYPFGIDNSMCAMNKNFFLNCSRRDSPPKLMIGDLEVFNLSIENGSMIASFFTAHRCYDGLGNRTSDYNDPYVKLGSRPLRFSDTRNKLMAIGCDTSAYMGDPDGSFWTGCISMCTNESAKLNESSCSGIGCCQIPLPQSHKSLNLTLRSVNDHEDMGRFMACDYALLADETFNIAEFLASEDKSSSNVTIEWVVKEKKCPDDPNSKVYGCGDNTACYYSENGQGSSIISAFSCFNSYLSSRHQVRKHTFR
ncbi:hypothetical protein WN944_027374 [Citrus x changshan-huyou]|uniref:Wall-associated receptor kinase galacturonan-binding domain-containing protein n=1 Tax=Citrus x changshan-huyou TaxID=2935761 RepID=A0AAP0Q950_9ROSI